MELNELIKDCARRQKKGLHFILTSILIWAMICAVHLTDMPIDTKNLITFCCSAVLFPLAWMLSKVLKIDFEGKGNPLTKAGILFSINQMLYILIVMWVYAAVPEKMVMVYAMVFGAHLMPFSWLYDSRSYMVFSIVVPILSLIVGLIYPPAVLAALMIVIEAVFSVCLFQECKKLR
jgi:fumarate reductase subunit D